MGKKELLKRGEIVAGLRIDEPIAVGGFAIVYSAERCSDGVPVVVKALRHDAKEADRVAAERFIREASVAAQLDHPHIVRILDYGQSDEGVLYIVMERLFGHTLTKLMFKDPVPSDTVHTVLTQTLSALAAAHEFGIVHRDLKPSNVFLCAKEGEDGVTVKLLDFGFLKFLDEDAVERLTLTGERVGTPGYMAPELLVHGIVTPQADLYTVGILAYELLTATPAFKGKGMQKAFAQVHDDPVPPGDPIGALPIYGVVDRLIARDPEERFQTAADALSSLEALRASRKKKRWFKFWR